MLELPILAIYLTCIAGMIRFASKRRDSRPPWERDDGKEKIEIWLKAFLPKLTRNSTRTQKCRLISSIERMNFKDDSRYWNAAIWQFVRFGENEAEILRKYKRGFEKLKLTEFQKMILKSNRELKNEMMSRSEINEENGKWHFSDDFEIISEGGEALVLKEKFGDFETAVRLQIFDSFLFTENFGFDSISFKIHFQKG